MIRMLLHNKCILCDPTAGLFIDGQEIATTHMERELLHYFLSHPDEILGRKQLLRDVWGYEIPGNSRTVDAHVKMLRQTLSDTPFVISTIHGVGYRFETDCCRECCEACCCGA